MNINASLVDQQIIGFIAKHPNWFEKYDANKQKASAFVMLCIRYFLDISEEDSFELFTDGGNDAGVDGLHIGDVEDGEFLVTIFQGKYKINNLNGDANFPETAVKDMLNVVLLLFDPYRPATFNEKIRHKIEEVRSLIQDGYMPRVRIVFCNNGAKWNDAAQLWVDKLIADFADKIEVCHFNHDSIVSIIQKTQRVDVNFTLSGKMIVEDMHFMRVMVGKVAVQQIADIMEEHGDTLLQRNIRRYLGLSNNRVNMAIQNTLTTDKSENFYFYNNGITIVCDKFEYNAFQQSDYIVKIKNMQIINGGQTCKTIHDVLKNAQQSDAGKDAYVMVRIYQLEEDNNEFTQAITYATNSQNPVDLRDLHSNDEIQKQLEQGFKALDYTYKRMREDGVTGPSVITSSVVAESVLAIWRHSPHLAKFRRKEHFGTLYNEIFTDLTASQALLAVLIFREVENERKKPSLGQTAEFLPYASHYIAMQLGALLLKDAKILPTAITHTNIEKLLNLFVTKKKDFYLQAVQQIDTAIKDLYGDRNVSLQQLSATFRRGDLLTSLHTRASLK